MRCSAEGHRHETDVRVIRRVTTTPVGWVDTQGRSLAAGDRRIGSSVGCDWLDRIPGGHDRSESLNRGRKKRDGRDGAFWSGVVVSCLVPRGD